MRKYAVLALLSILTTQTAVVAQGGFGSFGAAPRSLTFTPINPTRAMGRPGILTSANPFGAFNPGNLLRGVRVNLLKWPPITASSGFPNDVQQQQSSYPTEIFEFPTQNQILNSSSLPSMTIQSQFIR